MLRSYYSTLTSPGNKESNVAKNIKNECRVPAITLHDVFSAATSPTGSTVGSPLPTPLSTQRTGSHEREASPSRGFQPPVVEQERSNSNETTILGELGGELCGGDDLGTGLHIIHIFFILIMS